MWKALNCEWRIKFDFLKRLQRIWMSGNEKKLANLNSRKSLKIFENKFSKPKINGRSKATFYIKINFKNTQSRSMNPRSNLKNKIINQDWFLKKITKIKINSTSQRKKEVKLKIKITSYIEPYQKTELRSRSKTFQITIEKFNKTYDPPLTDLIWFLIRVINVHFLKIKRKFKFFRSFYN